MKIDKKRMFSNKDLSKLIIPLMIEQLLAVMVGLIDSVMIGSVGEAAISGVSLVDNIMILLISLFAALATGGAVVAGHYLGEKKEEKACAVADQLVLFTVVLSVVITMVIFLGKNFILHTVFGKIEPDVMGYADTYLVIVSLSIPFIALYNGCAGLFRATGNSKISMMIALLMNVINIAGNSILIYGLKMEVTGAAIATLASRAVAGIVIFLLLRREKNVIHLSKSLRPRFHWGYIKRILYIGVPNGLENSMFQLGKIMVLSLVSTFGTISITANAVSSTLALFQILPGMAVNLGVVSVVSRCIGARDYEQAKYYTLKMMKVAYTAMIVSNVIVFCLLPFILKIYNLSSETSSLVTRIIIFYGITSVLLWPTAFMIPNTLRSANDVKFSMGISILSMWMLRLVPSYILGVYFELGVIGVWMAYATDWFFRSICFVVRYRRGKWMQHKIS